VGVKLFEFANNFNHSQIKRRITMMTKRKSKRWAKFKVLLILPLLSFLVLIFADSNTAKEPDKAKQKDVDNVVFAQGDAQDSTHAKDQKKAEEKKKKELAKKTLEEMKKIEMSIQELKEKYKATDDPEMRKKIKAKATALSKKMTKLKEAQKVDIYETSNDGLLELEKLEKKYKATDDPEMKKQIKMKMTQLKKNIEKEKKIEMTIMELEKKYKATDDPELKKKIKEKLSVLKKELQKKKK